MELVLASKSTGPSSLPPQAIAMQKVLLPPVRKSQKKSYIITTTEDIDIADKNQQNSI